ncbi:hypothetical protein [Andreprevotia sp. IGB-42]|uniref:hypothetical protein n=1 Tax=Andreprevotia sp. IGB-42 TaxID=2497473 RepID=UPI0013588C11|nr:hypothetical protein [Andreprevotia sp. IGB-42]
MTGLKKISIWALVLLLLGGGVYFAGILSLQSDTLSAREYVIGTMIRRFGPYQEALETCWEENAQIAVCSAMARRIRIEAKKDEFFYWDDMSIVGVDYKNRVVVIFRPQVKDNGLHWMCLLNEMDRMWKTCQSLASVSR